jgi:hypothetical protein
LDNINVTGAWSFDLKGKAPEQIKLYLIQNEDTVIGQGAINRGNITEKAKANGSISGEKMNLTVISVDISNRYKLNLSLSCLQGRWQQPVREGYIRSFLEYLQACIYGRRRWGWCICNIGLVICEA